MAFPAFPEKVDTGRRALSYTAGLTAGILIDALRNHIMRIIRFESSHRGDLLSLQPYTISCIFAHILFIDYRLICRV